MASTPSLSGIISYLETLGYHFIRANPQGPVSSPDIIVYEDEAQTKPLIIVEEKKQLPQRLDLLDPRVQQGFRHATLAGGSTQFLLVTDGRNHHWFRLLDNGSSLSRTA